MSGRRLLMKRSVDLKNLFFIIKKLNFNYALKLYEEQQVQNFSQDFFCIILLSLPKKLEIQNFSFFMTSFEKIKEI